MPFTLALVKPGEIDWTGARGPAAKQGSAWGNFDNLFGYA
jgi:hypothetical protein